MLRIEHISKAFGSRQILHDVSLDFPQCQITGLFGDSGSGKSTLARMICGMLAPDEGQVFLDQVPLWHNGHYDRAQGLGIQMVFQQPYASFDPRQRIDAALEELIRFHRLAPDKSAAREMINEVIKEVQLKPSVLTHLPHQISGGEAQRLSLARLLLLKPKFLILDEATSMLDVSSQAVLVSLLRRTAANHDLSVLWISHDLPLLQSAADQVYRLENKQLTRSY